jgi:hypothetical protein
MEKGKCQFRSPASRGHRNCERSPGPFDLLTSLWVLAATGRSYSTAVSDALLWACGITLLALLLAVAELLRRRARREVRTDPAPRASPPPDLTAPEAQLARSTGVTSTAATAVSDSARPYWHDRVPSPARRVRLADPTKTLFFTYRPRSRGLITDMATVHHKDARQSPNNVSVRPLQVGNH